MTTLIRRRVLRRLIWVCTLSLCPKNGTLGLYGLIWSVCRWCIKRSWPIKKINDWTFGIVSYFCLITQNENYKEWLSFYLAALFHNSTGDYRCRWEKNIRGFWHQFIWTSCVGRFHKLSSIIFKFLSTICFRLIMYRLIKNTSMSLIFNTDILMRM